jgi:hypothetical protein
MFSHLTNAKPNEKHILHKQANKKKITELMYQSMQDLRLNGIYAEDSGLLGCYTV